MRACGFVRRGEFQWLGRFRPDMLELQTEFLNRNKGTVEIIGGLGDPLPPARGYRTSYVGDDAAVSSDGNATREPIEATQNG